MKSNIEHVFTTINNIIACLKTSKLIDNSEPLANDHVTDHKRLIIGLCVGVTPNLGVDAQCTLHLKFIRFCFLVGILSRPVSQHSLEHAQSTVLNSGSGFLLLL